MGFLLPNTSYMSPINKYIIKQVPTAILPMFLEIS